MAEKIYMFLGLEEKNCKKWSWASGFQSLKSQIIGFVRAYVIWLRLFGVTIQNMKFNLQVTGYQKLYFTLLAGPSVN